eukprot:Gb_15470 [translate_table: standard]
MQRFRFGRIGTWIQSKILIYNVTSGLYMLDWWERYLFNTMLFLLLCVICYNCTQSIAERLQRFIWFISTGTHENKFIATPEGHYSIAND